MQLLLKPRHLRTFVIENEGNYFRRHSSEHDSILSNQKLKMPPLSCHGHQSMELPKKASFLPGPGLLSFERLFSVRILTRFTTTLSYHLLPFRKRTKNENSTFSNFTLFKWCVNPVRSFQQYSGNTKNNSRRRLRLRIMP